MIGNSLIQASYTWAEFRAMFAKTSLAKFVDEETGESFTKVAFIRSDDTKVFVGFSQKLGVLSKEQLLAQRGELRIVKRLKVNATSSEDVVYTLCKGSDSAWEDLD